MKGLMLLMHGATMNFLRFICWLMSKVSSSVKKLRIKSAILWGVTQGTMVIPYWRFGTTYRSHLQVSRRWAWYVFPKRRYEINSVRCVITQKVADMVYLFFLKYNQRDTKLHNLFIFVKFSTCFRRFLRPSSGAQNWIYSIGFFVKPSLLHATVVEELERGIFLVKIRK